MGCSQQLFLAEVSFQVCYLDVGNHQKDSHRYVREGQSIPSVEKAYRDFMYHMGKEYDKVISKNKTLKAQADKAGKFMDTIDFLEENQRQIKMLIATNLTVEQL